jgi:hypothetical protein
MKHLKILPRLVELSSYKVFWEYYQRRLNCSVIKHFENIEAIKHFENILDFYNENKLALPESFLRRHFFVTRWFKSPPIVEYHHGSRQDYLGLLQV